MPVGLILSAAIGAGAELFGAHEASQAAKTAAQTQEDAAAKALDFSKQIYSDQSQRLTPYVNAGTTALQNYAAYAAQPFSARVASVGAPYSPYALGGGSSMPASPPAYQLGAGLPAVGGAPVSAGGLGSGRPAPGGLVTVADDSGATRQVPSSQAALYQQRGFRVF